MELKYSITGVRLVIICGLYHKTTLNASKHQFTTTIVSIKEMFK